ncbi:hypothetical protein CFP56_005203, partial [Quercus suber]
ISGLLPQITRLFPNLGVGGLLGANEQRLSSLVDIPGCLTQVFRSLVPLVAKPSQRLREIACLICSPPIPSLIHCSITLVVNHLMEIDKSLESPQVGLLYQGFYQGIKTYMNVGHLFYVYQGVL